MAAGSPDVIAVVYFQSAPPLWRSILKKTQLLRHRARCKGVGAALASAEVNDAHGVVGLAWPLPVSWVSENHHILAVEVPMRQACAVHGCKAIEKLSDPTMHNFGMVLDWKEAIWSRHELSKVEGI